MHPLSLVQQTLKRSFTCTGIGLHSGHTVTITLEPAPCDHGIVFVRQDLPNSPSLNAHYRAVTDTFLCSKLSTSTGESISTTEHLMAALAACQIDNVRILVEGSEIPLMDGSALPFIENIEKAGIHSQSAPRAFLKILKTLRVEQKNRWVELSSQDEFSLDVTYDFQGRQGLKAYHREFKGNLQTFKDQIAGARTFGFYEEAQYLHAKGLSLGASLENVVVIDEGRIMNPEGLRFEDEFVRHKILDALGDLYLARAPLQGKYSAYNGGHELHFLLLKALFEDEEAWQWQKIF